jgi:AcrR family transcriptional regulator
VPRPPAAPPDAAPARRTQGERAAETRGRILDATVDCLVEDGYAGTSTNAVQRRAGVSRGALMHHFPSKQDLLLDAVAHLAVQRGLWLREQVHRLPAGSDPQAAGIALLWQTMSGPLFAAATELWIAARTDERLRRALIAGERRLGAAARDLLGEVLRPRTPAADLDTADPDAADPDAADPDAADPAEDPAFRAALDYVLQVFRGASLTAILRDDARWERDLVAATTEVFRTLLAAPHDPPA